MYMCARGIKPGQCEWSYICALGVLNQDSVSGHVYVR